MAHVTPRLAALVRKELIRPDEPQAPGEDAFRFRHLLIRDAAYDGLPKAKRAELHERFADWLEEHGRSRRAGRDRWLPPRAGCPIPGRARASRSALRRRGRRAPRRGRRSARRRGDERAAVIAARAGAPAHAAAAPRRALELDLAWATTDATARGPIAKAAAERADDAGDAAGAAFARASARFHRLFSRPGARGTSRAPCTSSAAALEEAATIERRLACGGSWGSRESRAVATRSGLRAYEQALRHGSARPGDRAAFDRRRISLVPWSRPADAALRAA